MTPFCMKTDNAWSLSSLAFDYAQADRGDIGLALRIACMRRMKGCVVAFLALARVS
jgi:hypothetical protein